MENYILISAFQSCVNSCIKIIEDQLSDLTTPYYYGRIMFKKDVTRQQFEPIRKRMRKLVHYLKVIPNIRFSHCDRIQIIQTWNQLTIIKDLRFMMEENKDMELGLMILSLMEEYEYYSKKFQRF